ncbi:hypothetical protein JTE90_029509 [Oedothorax gibbosus]|uniref:Uncharacterized protein n=1 Tax=Oedothorax gibbosus TaxID=931172 RepID=A0AAV6UIK9_9ARAC|nr:hypothetical protein JTE90_029509 [Oedothorax gibbosus]
MLSIETLLNYHIPRNADYNFATRLGMEGPRLGRQLLDRPLLAADPNLRSLQLISPVSVKNGSDLPDFFRR